MSIRTLAQVKDRSNKTDDAYELNILVRFETHPFRAKHIVFLLCMQQLPCIARGTLFEVYSKELRREVHVSPSVAWI